MDKRTIAAVVLVVLIIIFMQTTWYKQRIAPQRKEPAQREEIVTEPTTAKEEVPVAPAQPAITAKSISNLEEIERKQVRIEGDFFRGTIDTKGALLSRWEIKPKRERPDDQEWVALLPTEIGGGAALSISMSTSGQEIDLEELVFECDRDSVRLSSNKPNDFLVLTAETLEGVRIAKEFTFYNSKHSMDMRVKIDKAEALGDIQRYTLWWKPGLRDTERKRKDDLRSFAAYTMLGDVLEKTTFKGESLKDSSFTGDTKWFGVQTKYFLMAMMPPRDEDGLGVEIRGRYQREDKEAEKQEERVIGGGILMPLRGGACDHQWEIYLGPMDYFTLKEYGNGLEQTVYLGRSVLRWIGLAILHIFINLHRLIPNYGVVIILFSILVKILFYPLTKKSIGSIRKMQAIQPEMSLLREKYKKDPAKLQRATMELYRKHKVNPASGCFPMLLQMPVFFALYAVFRNTIELRGASFLWIKDLSAPDTVVRLSNPLPLYGDSVNILPFIMAITMFIQQKISMRDPKQAYMVYMMPLFLFFIFNNISSGLVLYWTMFNVLQILQERLHPQHISTVAEADAENQDSK